MEELPCAGTVVWAKVREDQDPWWPAVVLAPSHSVRSKGWIRKEGARKQIRCVFLQSNETYTWLDMKKVRLFSKDDTGEERQEDYVTTVSGYTDTHLTAIQLGLRILADPSNPEKYLMDRNKEAVSLVSDTVSLPVREEFMEPSLEMSGLQSDTRHRDESLSRNNGRKELLFRRNSMMLRKPRKPPSGFLLFNKSERMKVKSELGVCTPSEVSQEVGRRWKLLELEKKEEFMKAGLSAKMEYKVALSSYLTALRDPLVSNKPRRTANGFILYCKAYRGLVAKELEGNVSGIGKLSKEMAHRWRMLTHRERQEFMEESRKKKSKDITGSVTK